MTTEVRRVVPAAYLKLGFVDTGHRQPYGLDPSRQELLLERQL